jgi:chemotaxis protein CheD
MTAQIHQAPSSNIHYDPVFRTEAAKILPGEYHVTDRDIVIVTVLGSCVAACIRDPKLGIGGMNHFMLPDSGSGQESTASEPARYGSYAMEVLINQLVKMGARRDRLEAKVFGGANVIPGMTQTNVGKRNSDFVLNFLKTEGIPVLARDLEDVCPRKVAYFPKTGVVKVKRLTDAAPSTLVEREQSYKRQLSTAPIAGEVDLFD